ncbi:TPD1 protein homolog 1-like [Oryza brachyantha]|uniref:Uncharacterized protein n=1 Tax=Oryza brachyantha TaxID=4533 RepID=J3KUD7_ORYBR|nr:TPD1 protein homolog 1-like [Oryza brachyantha]
MARIITTQLCTVFLVAIFVLAISVQGDQSQLCEPSSIQIGQTNTGKKARTLDTVFQVTVTNGCRCAVRAVLLRADGFASSVAVDPRLFRRASAAAGAYLVGDGQQIASGKSVSFQYTWDHYFKMTLASVKVVAC